MEAEQLIHILKEHDYDSQMLPCIEKLDLRLATSEVLATFIDIDTVSIDNRRIRNLTHRHPSVYFFCMSHDKFHPELRDAICYHIYACLNKPIDPDELIYWLRCIHCSENDSRGPPRAASTTRSEKET